MLYKANTASAFRFYSVYRFSNNCSTVFLNSSKYINFSIEILNELLKIIKEIKNKKQTLQSIQIQNLFNII